MAWGWLRDLTDMELRRVEVRLGSHPRYIVIDGESPPDPATLAKAKQAVATERWRRTMFGEKRPTKDIYLGTDRGWRAVP